MTECDAVIFVMDILSIKKNKSHNDKKGQYYIAANVTSTASVKFYSKKVRDSHILYTVLLLIILL